MTPLPTPEIFFGISAAFFPKLHYMSNMHFQSHFRLGYEIRLNFSFTTEIRINDSTFLIGYFLFCLKYPNSIHDLMETFACKIFRCLHSYFMYNIL